MERTMRKLLLAWVLLLGALLLTPGLRLRRPRRRVRVLWRARHWLRKRPAASCIPRGGA
jgi:hypothetical protein